MVTYVEKRLVKEHLDFNGQMKLFTDLLHLFVIVFTRTHATARFSSPHNIPLYGKTSRYSPPSLECLYIKFQLTLWNS